MFSRDLHIDRAVGVDAIEPDETIMILESMKMEISVLSEEGEQSKKFWSLEGNLLKKDRN